MRERGEEEREAVASPCGVGVGAMGLTEVGDDGDVGEELRRGGVPGGEGAVGGEAVASTGPLEAAARGTDGAPRPRMTTSRWRGAGSVSGGVDRRRASGRRRDLLPRSRRGSGEEEGRERDVGSGGVCGRGGLGFRSPKGYGEWGPA